MNLGSKILIFYGKPYNCQLQSNIHITRWKEGEASPKGHHSINSMIGERNGEEYLEKLNELSFSKARLIKLDYRVEKRDEEKKVRLLRRVSCEDIEIGETTVLEDLI